MSYIDKELGEELRQTASITVDQGQDHSSAPSPPVPNRPSQLLSDPSQPPVASSPLEPSLPQVASPLPPAIPVSHVELPQSPAPRHLSVLPSAAIQGAQESYIHPSTKLWSLYLDEADKEDAHLVESWKGDTEGILIFTGLFAAAVATFVAQTYQLLTPSSNDASAAILLQVSHQIAGLSNGTFVPAYVAPPFQAPFYAVWVNTLWFLSLSLSLTGALMAILMQQWTRRYLRGIRYRSVPHTRGPMQVMLRLGVKKYKMKQAVTLITSILHASVFFFFAGLVGFTFNLNSTVANVLTAFVSALGLVYITHSALPIFSTISPYDTVLTPILQAGLLLGKILLAFSLEQKRKFQSLFKLPTQLERRDSQESLEKFEERYSRSREQNLIRAVRRDDYFTVPRLTYVLDRVLKSADEHHEIENFLDSMTALLSRHRNSPLLRGQALEILFQQHLLRDKICSLIYSCHDFNSIVISLSTRIKRLRTVVAFIRHNDIRRVAHLGAKVDQHHNIFYVGSLPYDLHPSIALLSRLIRICSCMKIDIDEEIHYYNLTDMQAAADGWYSSHTHSLEWPLFCFVELVCTILKFISFDDSEDPVAVHRHLWEPILTAAQGYAVKYLWKSLHESEDLFVEPIPYALLIAAGLGDLIRPLHSLPARLPPTSEEQLKVKYAFSTHHILVDSLRDVATMVSLIPLHMLKHKPQSNPVPGVYATQSIDSDARRRAITNSSANISSYWVLFGPLTWGKQPDKEYFKLMSVWKGPFWKFILAGNSREIECEVTRDHPDREGYARIKFGNKATADKFVKEWTENPLPAYRDVTADTLDESNSGTDGRSGRDAVDAGEEGEAQETSS